MADLTWMRRHENIHQIETVHEINSQGKENHIIILPEEIKMPLGSLYCAIELLCRISPLE